MNDDLIRRSDVINLLWYFQDECCSAIVGDVERLPSADRPQGKWKQNVFRSDTYRYECSNCKAHHRARYDYCPSCGCRMKGADDDTN